MKAILFSVAEKVSSCRLYRAYFWERRRVGCMIWIVLSYTKSVGFFSEEGWSAGEGEMFLG